jgi:hypothetical protein
MTMGFHKRRMIMSFDIGGLFKSLINPMSLVQLAMGPAGWASIIAKAFISAVGNQLIQALGQELGLPQSIIDMGKQAFAAASGTAGGPQTVADAVGQLAEEFGLSPAEQGGAQRMMNDTLNNMLGQMTESEEFKAAKAAGGRTGRGTGGSTAGQSWLMALASVLGEKLNVMAKEVQDLAGQITKDTPDKTAKFGAATQEFSILMNATNNAIKTLGEGLTTTARKG